MKRTFVRRTVNGRHYNLLTLPGSNFFQFELINMIGSNVERAANDLSGKNLFGMAHFVEHLGFRATKDYSSDELVRVLKSEGTYNASTSHDRINYWYRTISNRAELAVKLVCNYALNDLRNIPADEFDIEKKVVYNEAKRYADDDQTMFYFNTNAAAIGYDVKEDNVIGLADTIDTFTLDDAIFVKDVFLSQGRTVFNITYDPLSMSEEDVIGLVEKQLERFPTPESNYHELMVKHDNMIGFPRIGTFYIENESEQVMTAIAFDVMDTNHCAYADLIANEYLKMYSETSLFDIIREKHGLTYSLHFFTDIVSYKPYTVFACDVSKGTEDLLMQLLEQSIVDSVDSYSQEKHDRFMDIKSLKRAMSRVDQKEYTKIHDTEVWYPAIVDKYEELLADDVDAAVDAMDEGSGNIDLVQDYLSRVKDLVINKQYTKVTNLK